MDELDLQAAIQLGGKVELNWSYFSDSFEGGFPKQEFLDAVHGGPGAFLVFFESHAREWLKPSYGSTRMGNTLDVELPSEAQPGRDNAIPNRIVQNWHDIAERLKQSAKDLPEQAEQQD